MTDDLQRVRQDLEVIRRAAGLTPPFPREEVYLHLGCVLSGLFALAWGTLQPANALARWGLLPALVFICGYVLFVSHKYRGDLNRSGMGRKEWLITAAVAIPSVVFGVWARYLGMSGHLRAGAMAFALGAVFAAIALVEPRRRHWLFSGIAFAMGGLLVPMLPGVSFAAMFGAVLVVSGAATAAHQIQQLRARPEEHGNIADQL